MHSVKHFFIVLICMFLLTGCYDSKTYFGSKQEVSLYKEIKFELNSEPEIIFVSNFSNFEIYTWGKDEIKFEMTRKVRGIQKKSVLEKKLEDFDIDVKEESGKIYFYSDFKGDIKNPSDKILDSKVYIPKRIKSLSCNLKMGNLKVYDDMKCVLSAKLDMANVDINRLEGKINVEGDMGNIRIANAKMETDSFVKLNMGNISIKSKLANQGNYRFETNKGNVELQFPSESTLNIEKIGTLEVNEFLESSNSPLVVVRSDMGKISLRKF